MEDFGKFELEWLRKYFSYENGAARAAYAVFSDVAGGISDQWMKYKETGEFQNFSKSSTLPIKYLQVKHSQKLPKVMAARKPVFSKCFPQKELSTKNTPFPTCEVSCVSFQPASEPETCSAPKTC